MSIPAYGLICRMAPKGNYWFCIAVLMALLSCTPQPALRQASAPAPESAVSKAKKDDTASVVLSFSSRAARDSFLLSIDSLLSTYRFDTMHAPAGQSVYLRVGALSNESAKKKPGMLATVREPDFAVYDVITVAGTEVLPKTDSTLPRGGAVTLYDERSFLSTDALALAAGCAERAIDTVDSAVLPRPRCAVSMRQTGPSLVILEIDSTAKGAAGRSVSAFDLADAWSLLYRSRPLDAVPVLGRVRGFDGFVRGQEAVVRGVKIRSERVVALDVARTSNAILAEIHGPLLVPPSLGLGPYRMSKAGASSRFIAVRNGAGRTALADTITVVSGGDANPLVSFSLGRYDAVTLTMAADIAWARRTIAQDSGAALIPSRAERYFLAIAHGDPDVRSCAVSALDPASVLAGLPKIDAHVVPGDAGGASPCGQVLPDKPLRVLFADGDPLSVRIAARICVQLKQQGIECRQNGADLPGYGAALYNKEYDIAVGWVPLGASYKAYEQARVAMLWFDHETSEQTRRAESRELPLFDVTRYFLCKPYVGCSDGTPAGFYVKGEGK